MIVDPKRCIATLTVEELVGLLDRMAVRREPVDPAPVAEPADWMSIDELRRAYRVGRPSLMHLITTGRLKASRRSMRGGRPGYYVRRVDAERVLGAKGVQ